MNRYRIFGTGQTRLLVKPKSEIQTDWAHLSASARRCRGRRGSPVRRRHAAVAVFTWSERVSILSPDAAPVPLSRTHSPLALSLPSARHCRFSELASSGRLAPPLTEPAGQQLSRALFLALPNPQLPRRSSASESTSFLSAAADEVSPPPRVPVSPFVDSGQP